MKIRSVVTLARGIERRLRRHLYPHGLRYRLYVLLQVVRDLDQQEGRRVSHLASAVLALILTGLGVSGGGSPPGSRATPPSSSAAGVLDTIHAPPHGRPLAGDTRRPSPSPPGRPNTTTVLASGILRTGLPRGGLA